ncbi:MAG: methylthioribulose 1-phosphate dehydratase [Planctomycetota bacterium]|nr:methylthioribulose 1-phosphate dehydratase [Planctomycetota bacterium]
MAHDSEIAALIETGAQFHARGWSLATSSNYSIRLSAGPLRLLITASGKDKGRLTPADFVIVGDDGKALDPAHPRPSAETLLHVVAAKRAEVGAVLHTHSVWNTLLSDRHARDGALTIAGFEMLKALDGVATHEASVRIPIFENTQDIPALAREVSAALDDPARPLRHGYLIRGHGLYTWGRDLAEARRHVEGLEFLFEVVGRGR